MVNNRYKNLNIIKLLLVFLAVISVTKMIEAREDCFRNINVSSFQSEGVELVHFNRNNLLESRMSTDMCNMNLTAIINMLENAIHSRFIFETSLLDIDGVSLKVENESLEDILQQLLDPYDIGFAAVNSRTIVIASNASLGEKFGTIRGKVNDNEGNPLPFCNIVVVDNMRGTATCKRGLYVIKKLKPGIYTIKFSFVGFKTETREVEVLPGKTTELNIVMMSESFSIGGIQVVAEQELLPTTVETQTQIVSADIEHLQATSLGDILDLVPGVKKSDNPGLDKDNFVAVRGEVKPDGEYNLSSFGTKVIIDGATESNNSNLQFENKGSVMGLGSSVDMRTIPADNIESVEIITGLPSVRYGDFTSGVINIKSKIGVNPTRLKVKVNPNTSEGNFGSGIALGEGVISYNINAAISERDKRVDGDEYSRYTGQVVYSDFFFDHKLRSNFKIHSKLIYDDSKPKNDLSLKQEYNRSYTVGASTWGEYKFNEDGNELEYNFSLSMKKIDSRRSKLIQSGGFVDPNTGEYITSYIGNLENKGCEWNIGARLEYRDVLFTGDFIHNLLIGSEFNYEANTGAGIIFDTLYNYYGADSKKRPYSFDEIPGESILGFYFEDKITGHFLADFSLRCGFRYEMYRPFDFNFSGLWGDGDLVNSYQGTFFNPRVNLTVYLSNKNQLRLSAGKTSKSPPMSYLFPGPSIMKWRNPSTKETIYFEYDRDQPNLKAYQEVQYEVSYDHKFFGMIGTSLTAYYKERFNEPAPVVNPIFYEFNNDGTSELYYVGKYTTKDNFGTNYNKGVEVSIKSNKIDALNMNFMVTGSYNWSNDPREGYEYDNDPDQSKGQFPNYIIHTANGDQLYGWMYRRQGRWNDNILINYFLKYTNKELGLWITLRAEQVVKEREQAYFLKPVDYEMMSEDAIAENEFQKRIKVKPNKWLFNVNVTKSLFKGAEVSFYVNNLLDDQAIYRYYTTLTEITESSRNPDIFYGLEFSMILDEIFN